MTKLLPKAFPRVVALSLLLALFLLVIGNSPVARDCLGLAISVAVLLACWVLLYRFACGVTDKECGSLVYEMRRDPKRRRQVLLAVFAGCAGLSAVLALCDAYSPLDVVPLVLWHYAFEVSRPI